jgi:hypothetical protein
LAFLQLSKQKRRKRTDPQANFKFLTLKKRPEHETVGFFATFKAKRRKRSDPQANFKFLSLKKRPEHETVGIFAIFNGKKCLELRVFAYFWMAI